MDNVSRTIPVLIVSFDKYAPFVWSVYGVTALVLIGYLVSLWARLRQERE